MSLHMLVWKELFRIDKGSPGRALHICSCMFITIAVVVINYTYSERYYFFSISRYKDHSDIT